MAHAQRRQVWHERGRIREGEVAIELQTVSGARRFALRRAARDGRVHFRPRRWTLALEYFDRRSDVGVARPILELALELAPPVRMFVDGTGQVDLLDLTEDIFHRDQQDLRRRARCKAMDREREGR